VYCDNGLVAVVTDVKGRLSELLLAVTGLARRHCCYNLCERLLREELSSNDEDGNTSQPSVIGLISRSMLKLAESDTDVGDHSVCAYREVAKLLFGRGQTQDAIEVMTATVSHSIGLISAHQKSASVVQELSARSLLSMSKWLQADSRLAAQCASLLQMSNQTDADTFTGRLTMLVDMARTSQTNIAGTCIELSPMDRREYLTFLLVQQSSKLQLSRLSEA